jgi:hypothetical protein
MDNLWIIYPIYPNKKFPVIKEHRWSKDHFEGSEKLEMYEPTSGKHIPSSMEARNH